MDAGVESGTLHSAPARLRDSRRILVMGRRRQSAGLPSGYGGAGSSASLPLLADATASPSSRRLASDPTALVTPPHTILQQPASALPPSPRATARRRSRPCTLLPPPRPPAGTWGPRRRPPRRRPRRTCASRGARRSGTRPRSSRACPGRARCWACGRSRRRGPVSRNSKRSPVRVSSSVSAVDPLLASVDVRRPSRSTSMRSSGSSGPARA